MLDLSLLMLGFICNVLNVKYNFTGQVLSRPNIEEIIKFAKEENLFLLADEVIE